MHQILTMDEEVSLFKKKVNAFRDERDKDEKRKR